MPVDDIVADEGRMAPLKFGWDTRFLADLGKIVGRFGRDREAVMAKVICVAIAAATFGALVEHDRDRLGANRACYHQRNGRKQ